MDLVYVYKRRTSEDELRYSLRSAAANLSFDRVVIVGDRPRTVMPDAHIRHHGPSGRYDNTCSKIIEAARSPEVSERFVLMNDDFFILKKFHQFPYLYSATLDDWLADYKYDKGNKYYKCAQRTREALPAGALFFGLHCPMVMEKERVLELARAFRLPRTMMLRSLYGNMYASDPQRSDDHKAQKGEDVARFKDAAWFSTSDKAARSRNFHQLMAGLFPEPSPFEKVA